MDVHPIDGAYELFRHFYGVPAAKDSAGREIGAVRGVLRSILSMFEQGATNVGVATDHVIESFRNELYAGYKTGESPKAAKPWTCGLSCAEPAPRSGNSDRPRASGLKAFER